MSETSVQLRGNPALVYGALRNMKEATVKQIASKLGIDVAKSGSTVAYLQTKGLVESIGKDQREYIYRARDPGEVQLNPTPVRRSADAIGDKILNEAATLVELCKTLQSENESLKRQVDALKKSIKALEVLQ